MVGKTHLMRIQSGQFQTITNIFSRLPTPRIQKNSYRFLFQNIKQSVQNILAQQNNIQQLQKIQQKNISSIKVKLPKFRRIQLQDQLMQQKLKSTNALFKSLIYLRNQKNLYSNDQGKESVKQTPRVGNLQPFLMDSHYINLQKSKNDIQNIKMLLQQHYYQQSKNKFNNSQIQQTSLKRHLFQFTSQNQIIFKMKSFPSTIDINRRATVLAKLYLLQLYKQQGKKLLVLDKLQQAQHQKKRRVQKIKQETQIQKMKQGQLIQDNDLLKQVYKIIQLIDKKMNIIAFEQFKKKNGQKAQQIKKSLQKLKAKVAAQVSPMVKLKILISYKYKKGW